MKSMRNYSLLVPSLACSVFALIGAPADVRSEPTPRLGVVVVIDVNLPSEERLALSRAVGTAVERAHPVEVISGWEAERRLPAGGIPEGCIDSRSCMNDLATRLDVDELLMLVLLRLGGDIQIDPTWYHAVSGRMLPRSAIQVAATERDLARALEPAGPDLRPLDVDGDGAGGPSSSKPVELVVSQRPPPVPERHWTTGAIVTAAVGATALLGSGAFGVATDRLHDRCQSGPCGDERRARVRRFALTADVLFGVAAVSTVATAYLYWRSDETPASPRTEVFVTAGDGGAGVFMKGRF